MCQKETDSNQVHILTIYMRPSDRMGMGWFAKMIARPKYLELMLRAKEHGIKQMIARHSLASFSKEKYIQTFGSEVSNPNKLLCLEMMGDYSVLKAFCEQEAELLQEAIVFLREVEGWDDVLSTMPWTRKRISLVRLESKKAGTVPVLTKYNQSSDLG